jgi:K+-sensing histidine kinase KdpD
VRPGEPELMAMAQQLVANPLVRTSCPAPRRLYGGGRPLLPIVACVSAVVLTTAALSIAGPVLGTKHLLMGYLLPATVIAIFFGAPFAVLTSVASTVTAAFFLVPPQFSFEIADSSDVAELGFFMLLALVASKAVAAIQYEGL